MSNQHILQARPTLLVSQLRGLTSAKDRYHGFWPRLSDQIRYNLALVIADVHQILLRPSEVINGLQHSLGRSSNLFKVWSRIYEVEQLDFTAIVEEGLFLLRVRLLLVKRRHTGLSMALLVLAKKAEHGRNLFARHPHTPSVAYSHPQSIARHADASAITAMIARSIITSRLRHRKLANFFHILGTTSVLLSTSWTNSAR